MKCPHCNSENVYKLYKESIRTFGFCDDCKAQFRISPEDGINLEYKAYEKEGTNKRANVERTKDTIFAERLFLLFCAFLVVVFFLISVIKFSNLEHELTLENCDKHISFKQSSYSTGFLEIVIKNKSSGNGLIAVYLSDVKLTYEISGNFNDSPSIRQVEIPLLEVTFTDGIKGINYSADQFPFSDNITMKIIEISGRINYENIF